MGGPEKHGDGYSIKAGMTFQVNLMMKTSFLFQEGTVLR